jgi:sigma-B regulation protein RsbU (phosphoserine phosphatase)
MEMIEPKLFYRELDAILATIRKEKSGKNFLPSILSELEKKFGESLRIRCSHIYEHRGQEFVLIFSSSQQCAQLIRKISVSNQIMRMVMENRSFIYNQSELIQDFGFDSKQSYIVPAAITINSPEKQWLFVFELDEGWSREEITLFLNAVRTALNYRMFSEMIWTEMERAVQIQGSLLPKSAPKIEGYDIYSHSKTAEWVGGDFYEYFQFDEEVFGVSIGDASGHGLPAALLVRDVVIGLRMGLAKEMRIVHTLKKLNEVIQRSTYSTNFVSMFIGEIEKGGHLFFVNAGHPPPFLIVGNKSVDLPATGITLGFMPEIELLRSYIRLEPGSILVMYTDGIVERRNQRDELFGIERFKETVIQNQNASAENLVRIVYDQVFEFGNQTSWEDDATLVVVKRLEKS